MAGLTKEQLDWIRGFVPNGLSRLLGDADDAGGSGQTDQIGGGLIQHEVSAGPLAAAEIASYVIPAPQPGNHGSWHDKSKIEFTSGYTLMWVGPDDSLPFLPTLKFFDERVSLDLPAPGRGRLTLMVTAKGTQDNGLLHSDESFTQEMSAVWQISADEKGTSSATLDAAPIGQHDGDTNYRLADPNVFTTAPLLGMRPRYIGTSDGTSSESGKSVNVSGGEGGLSGGGSLSWGDGTSSTKAPPAVQGSIVIQLNPTLPKKPPPPEPHGSVTVGTEVGAIVKLEFVIGPFKTGKTELEHGGLADEVRTKVWDALAEEEQDALIQGELAGQKWPDGSDTLKGQKIEVHGYASTADSKDHNLQLAVDRAQAVITILGKFGVPDSTMTKPVSHGEWDSVGGGSPGPTDDRKQEKDTAAWRMVVVKVNVARIYQT